MWRPFNLSLPGRISIAKSMLYSQINYLGCFLPMPDNITETISNLIVNFVKGNLNIAKKRLFLSVEGGGLGLFPVKDFLDAQKCAWIKRCNDLSEPWKLIIYISNFGCLFNSKSKNINKTESQYVTQFVLVLTELLMPSRFPWKTTTRAIFLSVQNLPWT